MEWTTNPLDDQPICVGCIVGVTEKPHMNSGRGRGYSRGRFPRRPFR